MIVLFFKQRVCRELSNIKNTSLNLISYIEKDLGGKEIAVRDNKSVF